MGGAKGAVSSAVVTAELLSDEKEMMERAFQWQKMIEGYEMLIDSGGATSSGCGGDDEEKGVMGRSKKNEEDELRSGRHLLASMHASPEVRLDEGGSSRS